MTGSTYPLSSRIHRLARRRLGRAAIVAAALAVWAPGAAHAGPEFAFNGRFAAFALGESVAMASVVGSMVGAMVNTVHAVRRQRRSTYWRVSGWVWGVLSLAGGGINLALGDAWGEPHFTALGVTGLAAGGLCLGTTIWAEARPERPARRLALVPMSAVDARGDLIGGAAVRLAGW